MMDRERRRQLLDFERTARLERLAVSAGRVCDELASANDAIAGIRLNLAEASEYLKCGRPQHALAVIDALIAEIDNAYMRRAS